MGRRRLGCAVLGVIAFGCVSTACGSSSSSGSPKWSLVALGDSVPYGSNCDCTPYPPLSADGITTTSGEKVGATNDAVPGYTTSDVLRQLESDDKVISHMLTAHAVEIEVGANDVAYSNSCGTSVECYAPRLPTIEKNLSEIVNRVHELTSGHKTLVVLLDYWSVWLGGQYAATKGEAYVNAAESMTDQVNSIIQSEAAKSGSSYVDLRAAFKGPDYSYDETHYLSNDGDHPNAAGHKQIAAATEAVIEKTLHI
jgi:lysophospholipase L1-like esterase